MMDEILRKHMEGLDPKLLATSPAYRRAVCQDDPIRFAAIYLLDTISDPDTGEVSFSPVHEEWAELAKAWTRTGARKSRENRHAFVAPRKTGKTSWWYLILPMWWAAYGYSKFIAAFSDTASQSQTHLNTFRKQLDENALLREDFPELCALKKRVRGMAEGDSAGIRICGNGFIFMAKGLDSSSLGTKIGNLRPDTLVIDDAEPDASSYSLYQKGQRLDTIQNSILYQDLKANVVWTGTVTMHGSCVHDMVRYAKGERDAGIGWVGDEKFSVHHYKPIIENEDGSEESFWPSMFTMEDMNEIRHTAPFKLNMENDPMGSAGLLWQPGDIRYAEFPCDAGTYLSIDPIVSKGNMKSDLTGVAVVGCATNPRRSLVKFATGVRLTGKELKRYLEGVLELHPECSRLLVETNQGGDLFEELFEDLPIKVVTYHSTQPKEVRAGRLLKLYQTVPEPLVFHTERHNQAESEMFTYPNMGDDITDAIGAAVLKWVKPEVKVKPVIRQRFPR